MNPPRTPILQLGRLMPALEERLAADYAVTLLAQQADPRAFLAARGAEFVAAVTSAPTGIDAATLAALPALRVVSSFGVGLDQIDLAGAARRGIAVGYTPDVLTDCVADIAFALLLDVARRVSEADRHVRRGAWLEARFPLATRVSGKRLGIVGMGRIGRTIARRSTGFEMEVRYYNRSAVSDVPYGREPDLESLARWADFLVVAAAGGPSSQGLISERVLQALGPQGYLVNIARGSLVDEDALVRALQQRTIAGAGLDVFRDEPRVPQALFELDNVVLLPHVASATHETRQAMMDLTLRNLAQFLERGELAVAAPLP